MFVAAKDVTSVVKATVEKCFVVGVVMPFECEFRFALTHSEVETTNQRTQLMFVEPFCD